MLFFARSITQSVYSGWKQSIVKHHDQVTHLGTFFNNRSFRIFHNGWTDCRDAFHATLYLQHYKTGRKSVNMKHIS